MGLMVGCFLKNLDKTENVVKNKKWKFHGMDNKETNAVNSLGSTADGCSDKNKEFLIWQVEVNGNLGKVEENGNLGKAEEDGNPGKGNLQMNKEEMMEKYWKNSDYYQLYLETA